MALEESRKRKNSTELVENDEKILKIDEITTEPEAKIQKIVDTNLNLKIDENIENVPTNPPINDTPEDLSINTTQVDESPEDLSISTSRIDENVEKASEDDKITKNEDTVEKACEDGEIITEDRQAVIPQNYLLNTPKTEENVIKSDDAETVNEDPQNVVLQNAETSELNLTNSEPISRFKDSILTIQFKNSSQVDLYKQKFLKFINTFIELEAKVLENGLGIEVFKDETLNPDEWEVCDETLLDVDESPDLLSPSKKRKKKSKAKKELFVVDATPSSNATKESSDLRYTSKFSMNSDNKDNDEVKKPKGQACFNCEETGHNLRDCPLPKDYAKINAARQKFKPQLKAGRYHLEDEQKFGHLKPGKISAELREALGLRKNELPHFVYLMRRLGYPPGWLEEAKFMQSNLELFGVEDLSNKKVQVKKGLDVDKIIDFPGFNLPLEKDVKDDHRSYGVPPYSENFSKDAMIKFFNDQYAKEQDNLENCDMDVDDEDPGCQNSELISKSDSQDADDSATLGDLEKQKAELLAALDVNGDDSNSKAEIMEKKQPELPGSPVQAPIVKTSSFGTPILKSSSPYMTLPNPDNFSKDVSPVINFENLPNSTGKYEQMTDVLQKVRDTMKKLQNCDT